MKVTIFGSGYVGLVTGACLAEVGHEVTCVDIDEDKINGLRNGQVPIFEPGLAPMIGSNQSAGRLKFTTNAAEGITESEVIFIAVGTPSDEDGSADLRYVLAVARTIGEALDRPALVVNKSTVPVGTADKVRETISTQLSRRHKTFGVEVVSNPEFLKEGAAIEDCMRPDRIVIGTRNADALHTLRRLYAPFNRNHERIVAMDVRSAELTKYAANAMLATKISFMNEIANIAEQVGADVEMVRKGIGSDPRIGWHFIYPGAGYGGSCFPKDVRALSRTARLHGIEPRLLESVEQVNNAQKNHLYALMLRHYGGEAQLRGKTVALWGLAFKPDTDDMREASSRNLLLALWDAGVTVRAFDPEAMHETRRIFGTRDDLQLCDSPQAALRGADALVVITEWKQFRSPDFSRLVVELRDAVLFDGRNIYDPLLVESEGIAYYGIGRGRSVLQFMPTEPVKPRHASEHPSPDNRNAVRP